MEQVAIVRCSIILRSLLAIYVSNAAAAFASKNLISKLQTQTSFNNSHQFWRVPSERSPFKGNFKGIFKSSSASLKTLSHSLELGAIPRVFGTIEWSDVRYDDTSTAFDAWEWTNGMGAPSAFVAAAVLVTLAETRLEMAPQREDKTWVRFAKRLMRFLLLSSFGFEISSIFVGSMTGSMLLGHGPQTSANKIVGYQSPLQLLQHHHE